MRPVPRSVPYSCIVLGQVLIWSELNLINARHLFTRPNAEIGSSARRDKRREWDVSKENKTSFASSNGETIQGRGSLQSGVRSHNATIPVVRQFW